VAAQLVVLDVMLPGLDGIEVCRRIQAHRPVPVLMLTARDDEADKLVGLGVGADDYVTKPFSMRELWPRVRTLLRRVERARELAAATRRAGRTVGSLAIDRAAARCARRREVPPHADGVRPARGAGARPRTVLTRERLLAQVWDWRDASGTRTVDSHVKALRRKLGADLIRPSTAWATPRGRRWLTCARCDRLGSIRSSWASCRRGVRRTCDDLVRLVGSAGCRASPCRSPCRRARRDAGAGARMTSPLRELTARRGPWRAATTAAA
jgi:DNA-binding response OmpR family regulator